MIRKFEQKSPAPDSHDDHSPLGLPLFVKSFAAIICGVICCGAMEYSKERQQTLQVVTTRQQVQDPSLSLPGDTAPEFSPVHRHYGASANVEKNVGDTPSGFLPFTRATVLPPDDDTSAVLYFHASWSGNCQRMGNTLKNSGDVQRWKSRLRILHVDSQKYPDLCKKYGVTDFPTLLFLAADGTTVRPLVGNRPVAQVLAFLENNAGRPETAAPQDALREPEQITGEETVATPEIKATPAKPRVRLHQLHRNQNQK